MTIYQSSIIINNSSIIKSSYGFKSHESSENTIELNSKIPLNQSFPFNYSNSVYLKDTKRSIKIGVKHAVRNYNDSNLRTLRDSIDEGVCLEVGCPDEGYGEENFNDPDIETSFTSTSSAKSSASSTFKSNLKDTTIQKVNVSLTVARNKINNLISENFQSVLNDKDIRDIRNYVINNIFQEFSNSDMNSICNKIIGKNNKELVLERIEELFIEKYVETKLYSFYDDCISSISRFEDIENFQKLNFYENYTKIWKFDNDEYSYYDYEQFKLDFFSTFPDFSYLSNNDRILNHYSNINFLMNLEKFHFYYSKEIKYGSFASKDCDSDDAYEIFSANDGSSDQDLPIKILTRDTKKLAFDKNNWNVIEEEKDMKSLRFCEDVEVLDINQSEPSCYIYYDLNDIEISEAPITF